MAGTTQEAMPLPNAPAVKDSVMALQTGMEGDEDAAARLPWGLGGNSNADAVVKDAAARPPPRPSVSGGVAVPDAAATISGRRMEALWPRTLLLPSPAVRL